MSWTHSLSVSLPNCSGAAFSAASTRARHWTSTSTCRGRPANRFHPNGSKPTPRSGAQGTAAPVVGLGCAASLSGGQNCARLTPYVKRQAAGVLTPRLEIFWVVERLVADSCHLDRVGLAEIFDGQLAALPCIRPRPAGARRVPAYSPPLNERRGEGTPT